MPSPEKDFSNQILNINMRRRQKVVSQTPTNPYKGIHFYKSLGSSKNELKINFSKKFDNTTLKDTLSDIKVASSNETRELESNQMLPRMINKSKVN
jgi:hypothetical protein